jgi:glycosyltransferase involved in cell wall biosynthesis
MAPVQLFYEASPGVHTAVRRADAVLSPAPSALSERIQRLYGKDVNPQFVPYPIDLPENPPKKASKPTVLFVGRFDHRKRVEIFFDLAPRFPNVDFIAVGKAHEESYDRSLRQRYGHLKNLTLTGFISRFDNRDILPYYERSWILVNTSAREGLPYTFLEAAGYGVSVLSCLNPESFASKYGYFVSDGDFESGLHYLLEKDRWREAGERAMKFVHSTWKEEESINRHLELYKSLMGRN